MKEKKPTEKQTPTPEFDSERETRVLLEKIDSDVKTIAEQVASNSTKLMKIGQDTTELKVDMSIVKTAVQQNTAKVEKIDKRLERVEQKLDTVTENHERRIQKFEAVR